MARAKSKSKSKKLEGLVAEEIQGHLTNVQIELLRLMDSLDGLDVDDENEHDLSILCSRLFAEVFHDTDTKKKTAETTAIGSAYLEGFERGQLDAVNPEKKS